MQLKILLLLISLLGSKISFLRAQELINPLTFDYSKADSIALHFPKKKYTNYSEIVYPLINHLTSEQEKFRVLFRWITNNIEYSYSNRSGDANKVIKNKKAVCAGYSNLLKEMCTSAGIECEVITGYSKTTIADINKKLKKSDHAWNAVKLNGKWYLVDVTWATSYYDRQKKKFVKYFDETYFLTAPDLFIKSHFPEDKKWQLLDNPVSKNQFKSTPIYYSDYLQHKINLKSDKGIIKMELKDSLDFKFTMLDKVENIGIQLEQNNARKYYRKNVQKKEDEYVINQKFEKPGIYELTLFINNKCIATYKLILKE